MGQSWWHRPVGRGRGFTFECAGASAVLPGVAGASIVHYMGPVVCSICDRAESDCKCGRYCCICGGQEGIRLCTDGLYYCPDCREACEVSPASLSGSRHA